MVMCKTHNTHNTPIRTSLHQTRAYQSIDFPCDAASLPNAATRGFMRKLQSPMSLFACLLSFSNMSESQRFKYSAAVGSDLF